jgi:hypothetical protein
VRSLRVSHFDEVDIPTASWHTVPERVLTVRLDGSVAYETSAGEARYVPAGGFDLIRTRMGKATSRVIPRKVLCRPK